MCIKRKKNDNLFVSISNVVLPMRPLYFISSRVYGDYVKRAADCGSRERVMVLNDEKKKFLSLFRSLVLYFRANVFIIGFPAINYVLRKFFER